LSDFCNECNREKQKARKQSKKMIAKTQTLKIQQIFIVNIRAQKPDPCRKSKSLCDISITQMAGKFHITPTTLFREWAQQTLDPVVNLIVKA